MVEFSIFPKGTFVDITFRNISCIKTSSQKCTVYGILNSIQIIFLGLSYATYQNLIVFRCARFKSSPWNLQCKIRWLSYLPSNRKMCHNHIQGYWLKLEYPSRYSFGFHPSDLLFWIIYLWVSKITLFTYLSCIMAF